MIKIQGLVKNYGSNAVLRGADLHVRTKSGATAKDLARRDNSSSNKRLLEMLEEFEDLPEVPREARPKTD